MSKHTPGPWAATQTPNDGRWAVLGPAFALPMFAVSPVTSEANARLIAAAPDLLDALKWLARGEHEWSAPPQAIAFMERAIAKAEGLSPFVSPVGGSSQSY